MKKSVLIFAAALLVSCADPEPATELLWKVRQSGGMMYAMQDCMCYGKDWHVSLEEAATVAPDRCDVKSVCGDYPAIVGFDLGERELCRAANIDKVPWEFMRRAAVAHAGRGGIVTFSWHARNPLTGGDAWDCSSDRVVASILPGGSEHYKFMGWLKEVADFLDSLRFDDGSLIPIIFRPYHENTGSWFWWGKDLCTEDEYKALWLMTYEYLVEERDLEGMTWAYSPSNANLVSDAMARYPGDEIIDLIGVDQYDGDKMTEVNPAFTRDLRASLEYLAVQAKEHDMLLAVTETGQGGMTVPDWWTECVLKATEGLPVSYVLTWRNAWDRNDGHWFGPFPGAPCEDDFRDFYDSDRTVFLKQLNQINKR